MNRSQFIGHKPQPFPVPGDERQVKAVRSKNLCKLASYAADAPVINAQFSITSSIWDSHDLASFDALPPKGGTPNRVL